MVDKSLQYKFLALVLIYGGVIVVFLALCLFMPDIWRMQDQSLSIEARTSAAEKILTLHARVWPAVIALICVIGLHSFRIFHRLVGPLYRFRVVFGQVRDGDLSHPVRIRERDYLHKEEDALNEMLEVLHAKLNDIQGEATQALQSLQDVEHAISGVPGWGEAEKSLVLTHREHVNRIADTASYFRGGNATSEGKGMNLSK
jgi:methyl-accepting chemotaxis protein